MSYFCKVSQLKALLKQEIKRIFIIFCSCLRLLWHHLEKLSLRRSKQWFPMSAFSIRIYSYNISKLCRKWEKCLLKMLICDKNSRLWSDAGQNAQHLIRACSLCSRVFPDDVTFLAFVAANYILMRRAVDIVTENNAQYDIKVCISDAKHPDTTTICGTLQVTFTSKQYFNNYTKIKCYCLCFEIAYIV